MTRPYQYSYLDGTSFASFLLNGPGDDTQHREIKDLTLESLKPAVEARVEYTKEIVLTLIQLIENWSAQRDSFWTSLKDKGRPGKIWTSFALVLN